MRCKGLLYSEDADNKNIPPSTKADGTVIISVEESKVKLIVFEALGKVHFYVSHGVQSNKIPRMQQGYWGASRKSIQQAKISCHNSLNLLSAQTLKHK